MNTQNNPIPIIILGTQHYITQNNCDKCASEHENEIDDQQESKDVKDAVRPDRIHDIKEFNKHGSKGENTAQDHGDGK